MSKGRYTSSCFDFMSSTTPITPPYPQPATRSRVSFNGRLMRRDADVPAAVMPRPFPKDDEIASARYSNPPPPPDIHASLPELATKRKGMMRRITRLRIAAGGRAGGARALFPRRGTPAAGDRSIENYFSDYPPRCTPKGNTGHLERERGSEWKRERMSGFK